MTKKEVLDAYQMVQQSMIDEREDTSNRIGEWIMILRSVAETLDDTLATDYQMETVRQAVDGLIIQQLAHYKKIMNLQ